MITYFIQSGDFVKIGRTKNLRARFNAIQTGLPLPATILCAAVQDEKEAHLIAHSLTTRHNGEWFKVNESLKAWIASLKNISGKLLQKQAQEMATVTISVPVILAEQIKAIAAINGRSPSWQIRAMLMEAVAEFETTNTGAEA